MYLIPDYKLKKMSHLLLLSCQKQGVSTDHGLNHCLNSSLMSSVHLLCILQWRKRRRMMRRPFAKKRLQTLIERGKSMPVALSEITRRVHVPKQTGTHITISLAISRLGSTSFSPCLCHWNARVGLRKFWMPQACSSVAATKGITVNSHNFQRDWEICGGVHMHYTVGY